MSYRLLNPYTLVFLLTAVFSVGIAVAAYRNRSKRAALPMAGFMIAVSLWCVGDAMRIAAPSPAHVLFWNKVSYVGIAASLPTWVTFALALTNRERWLQRRYILALIGVSLTALGLMVTNDLHGLWRAGETITVGTTPPVLDESRGLLWYPWAIYSYALVVASLYFVLREFLQSNRSRTYRSQIGLILAGSIVAVGSTAVYILGFVPFDITPFGVAFMGLTYATALFRYQLLDITPIARDVVLDSVDSGVLVLDHNDRIVDVNAYARELIPQSDPEGVDVRSLLPESVSYDTLFADTDSGDEPVTVETGGERRHFDLEISPITDSLGSVLGYALIFTDVTELVEKRRRLQRRTERLEQQNERLDQFASVVSHDLRNPLQVAAGSLELSRELDDGEQIDRAERAIERMESIVDDLLTLSRVGNEIGETEPVDLRTVAVEARHHVDTGDSEIDIAEALPTVEADQKALLHVFENLFRNAIDHNDHPVTVSVGPDGDRGFYVADDGTGIPESKRESVFDHGFSTDDTGTGFGLSIVRDVVQAHGWDIRVTEASDGGARFEIDTT